MGLATGTRTRLINFYCVAKMAHQHRPTPIPQLANQSKQKSVAQFWARRREEVLWTGYIVERAIHKVMKQSAFARHSAQNQLVEQRSALAGVQFFLLAGTRRQINSFHCLENVEHRIGTDVWTWTDALA